MILLLLHVEILGMSGALVGLHALRRKLGVAPFYLAVGLLLAYMTIGGRLKVLVPVVGADTAYYSSLAHLTLVLTAMVLVYTLDGTRDARRLIAALVVAKLCVLVLKLLLAAHLAAPGVDLALYGRERWASPQVLPGLLSTGALAVDGLVIIVVYQATINLSRRTPVVVALSVALLAALAADALVYGGLSGRLDLARFVSHLVGKLTAGVAAALPAAAYLSLAIRRSPEEVRGGVRERGALSIVDLRRELRSVRAALARSETQYANMRDLFGRYVVPDVIDDILEDASKLKLGGELREVTILFSDIRGYSTMSEGMSPEETIRLLNEYFGAMSDVIFAERGTIIEFEGDAILAVFGAPLDQPDHAPRAVRTAMRMLDEVMVLNDHWDEAGTSERWRDLLPGPFRIRIGIHTGQVVVGNVGSEARAKYAVIGDTVNTAARVEGLNKQLLTPLLLTASTAEQLGDLDVELMDMGKFGVRGRKEPVHVYSVCGLPAPEVDSTGVVHELPGP